MITIITIAVILSLLGLKHKNESQRQLRPVRVRTRRK